MKSVAGSGRHSPIASTPHGADVTAFAGHVDGPRSHAATVIASGTAIVLGALIVCFARWGPDWPAQEFRAWLGARDSWALYTTRWYSGDSVMGYSVLYPAIAGVVGAGPVGVFGCALASWAGTGLVARRGRVRPVIFGIAIALSTATDLLIGQIPFLLGAAFAIVALRCTVDCRYPLVVCAAALLASLASPLSGAFLLLSVPSVAVTMGWRRCVPLLAAVTGSAVAALVGGAGGWFPCPWMTFLGVVVFCSATALYAPRESRALRVFAACYLLTAVVVFVFPNPVGGNIARLGKLLAVPLAVHLFRRRRGLRNRCITVVLTALAVLWPGEGLVSSIADGARDPSASARFYLGIDHYLAQHWVTGQRLEVPFTREHWEAYYLARHFPLARGWDRQTDLEYNAVLYGHLTAARYRAWLDNNAVAFIALPAAPIDFGGRAEAALLRHPPGYLTAVWHDTDWQVWKVQDPTPLVSGPARVTDDDPTTLTLTFGRPGSAVLRYRSTQLWQSTSPGACVSATSSGWTRVASRTAGTVTLTAGLSAENITPGGSSTSSSCLDGAAHDRRVSRASAR